MLAEPPGATQGLESIIGPLGLMLLVEQSAKGPERIFVGKIPPGHGVNFGFTVSQGIHLLYPISLNGFMPGSMSEAGRFPQLEIFVYTSAG
jgi:hypothetical protein